MKINLTLNAGDNASAQAAHKAVLNRSHGTKTGTHRYERRKVREFLRQAQLGAGEALEFAE